MNEKNKYLLFIFILILVIYYFLFPRGYINWYRSIPLYPNNKREVLLVEEFVNSRTKEDIEFFEISNNNMDLIFSSAVNEDINIINYWVTEHNILVLLFKYFINRARPKQIMPSLNVLDAKGTADTPAFPAGHALSGYYIAKRLKEIYPEKKEILDKIARDCDITRIKAGLHYPSDGLFSKFIVDYFL